MRAIIIIGQLIRGVLDILALSMAALVFVVETAFHVCAHTHTKTLVIIHANNSLPDSGVELKVRAGLM